MRPTLLLFVFCLFLAHAAVHALDEDFWINATESVQRDLRYVANMATAQNGDIYAATGSGLWRSVDNGQKWDHVPISDFGIMPGVTILRDGSIMAGGRDSLHHSIDGGKTWTTYTHLEHGIPQIEYYYFVEKKDGTLFAAMHRRYSGQHVPLGIWQSKDRGQSWDLVCAETETSSESMCIGLHPNGDVFWGSWNRGGIFVLREETQTCHNVNTPFGGNLWEPLSMAVNSKGEIIIGTDRRSHFVYISIDTGNTWTSFDHWQDNRPDGKIRAWALDKYDRFFAGAGLSVWWTDNLAQTWTRLAGKLSLENIQSLSIDSSGYLYAGTNEGRIFRTRESIYTTTSVHNSDVESSITEQLNLTLSPNPAAGRLNVNFALESEYMVAVRLYDQRGLLLKQLPERRLAAGAQAVNLDVSDLGPGVYSLRLEAGGIVVNRLVAVVR